MAKPSGSVLDAAMQKLPLLLEREPLVDALFEVRLNHAPLLADILPGALFSEFTPRPEIVRLPAADFPQPLRANDPNLQYQPLFRLDLNGFFVSVGDRSFSVSCKLPYPKWPAFKQKILDVATKVAGLGFGGIVERYSLKYVNVIRGETLGEQALKVRMSITLGPIEVQDDHVSLQVHRVEGDVIHIVSVLIGAEAQLASGERVLGAVVDIDSIRNLRSVSLSDFARDLEPGLEALRQTNKVMFFGCLTDQAIKEMGPVYA